MYRIKHIAVILSLLFAGACLCMADDIKWKPSRYYAFSVSFRHACYVGKDEEVPKDRLGEALEDATDYISGREKNKGCDCLEVTEMDTARAYRDIECEDYSSIIILTDTGTYIRAYFYNMHDYKTEPDIDFGTVRDIFLLDDKKLEKVKVDDIYYGDWLMYDSFILEKKRVKCCDELLKIKYPRVNDPGHEGFESDFMLRITMIYSTGEQHIIGIDWSEHKLYVYGAWFGLTDEQYAEWLDALGLDKSRF